MRNQQTISSVLIWSLTMTTLDPTLDRRARGVTARPPRALAG
jgi:hypothetical protein